MKWFWENFRGYRWAVWTLLAVVSTRQASAALMVLVGEPFGNFGTMMPVGHTAVYLDRVCADGPIKMRMCDPGEPQGVVIARYHQLGKLDWVVSPVMQFLYATDHVEEIPKYVTADLAWEMRQEYRRRFMRSIVPDGMEKDDSTTEWWESAGVTFNRKVWGYEIATTREQDERFIAVMNDRTNVHAYSVRRSNCANFAADMVNLYFPGTVKANKWSDFGLMTPKQVARSVAAYGEKHPEAALRVVEIPQLPGSLRRSRPVRGTAEAGLKTKRYLATLIVIQPEVVVGCAVVYLKNGRWEMGEGASVAHPRDFATGSVLEAEQEATGTPTGSL